jgi:hypothetical protein
MPGCAARCRRCRQCRTSVASAHVRSASRYYEANDLPKAMAHFGRAMEYGAGEPSNTGVRQYAPIPTTGHAEPNPVDWTEREGTYYYDGGKFMYEYIRNPKSNGKMMCDTILVWLALYTPGDGQYGSMPMHSASVIISGCAHGNERGMMTIRVDLEHTNDVHDPLANRNIGLATLAILRGHIVRYISHSIKFGKGWNEDVSGIPQRLQADYLPKLEVYTTFGQWMDREISYTEYKGTGARGMLPYFDDERQRKYLEDSDKSRECMCKDPQNTKSAKSAKSAKSSPEKQGRMPLGDITNVTNGTKGLSLR